MKKPVLLVAGGTLALFASGYAAGALLINPAAGPSVSASETEQRPNLASEEEPAPDPVAEPHKIARDELLVPIGQITVPVHKSRSVTYVVADIVLKARDAPEANSLSQVETGVRVRDTLLATMHTLAEGPLLRKVSIDDAALAEALSQSLQVKFPGVEDILFVTLLKQDVPRF